VTKIHFRAADSTRALYLICDSSLHEHTVNEVETNCDIYQCRQRWQMLWTKKIRSSWEVNEERVKETEREKKMGVGRDNQMDA